MLHTLECISVNWRVLTTRYTCVPIPSTDFQFMRRCSSFLPMSSLNPPKSNQPLIFFHNILVLPILGFHISGDITFIYPFVSTSFLNIVFVRFNHVVACIIISSFLLISSNMPKLVYPASCWWTLEVAFPFGLSWIKLLSTFLYKTFCEHIFSLILDNHPGLQLLDHKESICWIL